MIHRDVDDDTSSEDAGDRWLRRVRRATDRVLGDSPAGREVTQLCRDHAESRMRILTDRADEETVIAVVGATGQGKSWLVRQLIRSGPVAAIRSGNQLNEATESLTWIGPRPPSDLDPRHETYVACEASKMQSVGVPYLLVDAPGATDDRLQIASVAVRALSMASVLILVVRRDQLRSQRVTGLASASEGSIVIPVINVVRPNDESVMADVESLVGRLRSIAPQSVLAPPVLIGDYELGGANESSVGETAAIAVASRISEMLQETGGGRARRGVRLAALDERFTSAVASVLESELPELTAAVKRLDEEARGLPAEVAASLLGGATALRAAIRSRLRVGLLTDTAALFFPYRSLLGTFNLTHGAWDRVMLSLAGSLPSLLSAVYVGAKNLGVDRSTQRELRDGLRDRTSAAVTDRLGPMARRFRHEIMNLQTSGASNGLGLNHSEQWDDSESSHSIATLAGIESLQTESQGQFDDAVQSGSVSAKLAFVAGFIGTLIFWSLIAGPLIELYREYFAASLTTIRGVTGDDSVTANLESFPRPDASFLLTGLLLSILPTALFAMVVLTLAQSRRRVDRIESDVRQRHDRLIDRLQKSGVLRLSWSDPLLADAEFLLSIGRTGATHR